MMSLLECETYLTIKFPLYRTRHEIPYMQFVMHLSFGDRSFSVAAPTLWNALPVSLRSIKCIFSTFKSNLKTYLFKLAFNISQILNFFVFVYFQYWYSFQVIYCYNVLLITQHYYALKQELPHNALRKELCSIKDHLKCLSNYELLKEQRRTGNFLSGGAVNHLPKEFLQVAQIITKPLNRNEGQMMQQHRLYQHMKVARYSFSGSIPMKFFLAQTTTP